MFARVATAPAAPLAPPNSHAPDDHRPRGNTSADDTPTLGDGTSLSHLLPSNSSTLLSREEPSSFISNVSAFDHGVMQLPPKTPSATSSYSSAPPPNIPATQPTSTASTNTLNTNPAASSPGTTENASLLFRDDSTAADVQHLHDVGGPQHAGTTTTLRSAEVPIIQPVDAPPHTRQTSLQQQWSAWRQHVAIPATTPTTTSSSPPAPLVGTPLTAPSTTAPAFTLRDVVPLAPKPRQQDTPRLSGTSDSSTYDSPLRTSNTQTNSARADTPPRSILRRPGSVPHSARSSRRISFASSRSPNDRRHVDSSDDDDYDDDDDDDDERFNEPMLSYASDDASSPPHRPSTELLAAHTAGDSPAIAHQGWADMNDNTPTPEKMPRDSGHHYALDDDNDDGAYEFEGTDVHTQPHVGYPSSSPVPLPPKPNNNNSSQPQPHHHHHHHSRKHSQHRESSSSTPPRSSTSSATPARRSTDHSRSPAPSSGSQAQRVACVCRRSTSRSSSRRSSASPARGSCSPQRPSDERLPRRKPQPEASTTPNMLLVENKEVADDVATQPHHQPEKTFTSEPTQRRRRRQRDAIPPSRNTTTNNSNSNSSEVMRTSVHAAEETMASARGDDHRQRRRRRSRSSRGRSSSISGEASLREQRASFVQQQQQHASASLEHSSTTKDEVPRKKLVDEGTQAHAEATEVVKVANARTQTSAITTNTTFTSTPQRASASASTQVSLLQPTQVEAATSSSDIISPRKRLALVVRRRNTDPRADNSIVRMKLLPVAESIRLRALIANVANNNNNKKHDSRRDGSSTPEIDLPRRSSSRRSRRRSGGSRRSISSRRASQTSSPHRRRSSRSRSNSPQQPMMMVNEKDLAHQHHHHLHRSSTRSPRSSRSSTSASRQPSADAATAPTTTPTTASSTPANDVAASAQVLTMNADVVAAAQPRDKTDEARKHRRSSSSTSAPRQHNNNNNVPEEQPKPKHRRQKKNASASSPVRDASSSSTKTHMLAELPPMDGDELDLLCSIAYQRKMLQHKKKQPQPRKLKQRDDGGGDDEAGKKIRTPREGEGGAAKDEAKKHKHRRHKTSSSPPTTKTTTSANAAAASTDAPVVRSSSVERRRGDDVVVQRRLLSPDKRALDVDAISETMREWRSSMSFNASPTTTTSATRVDPRSSARRDRIWSSGGGVGATTTAPRWSTSSYAYGDDDDDDDVLPRARQASTKWSDYVKDAARVRQSDANFGRYSRDDDASTTYSRYTYRSERNLNNNTYKYNTSRKSSISTFADRYADDVWRHKYENERGNPRRGGAAPPPPPPPPLYSDVDDVRSRGTSPDMDGGTKLFMHDDELVSTPPARGAASKSAQMKQRTIIDVSTSEDFARRVHGIAEALELYHDDVV